MDMIEVSNKEKNKQVPKMSLTFIKLMLAPRKKQHPKSNIRYCN